VIVRSQSGKHVHGNVPITSANLAEYAPSPADAVEAQRDLREAGFDVGPVVGISFAASAALRQFEKFFGVKLHVGGDGSVALEGRSAPPGGLELPLTHLSPRLAALITAVAFTPPADLHGRNASALF